MPSHVYLIDDDQQIFHLLNRFLPSQGFYFDGAEDLDWESLTSFRPDVILLDWNLKGRMCGITILNQLRDSAMRNVPVMFLSGRSDVEDRILALQQGADDYLVKPFELRELAARIMALLRRAPKEEVYQTPHFCVQPDKRKLLVRGEPRTLSQTEWVLFCALLRSTDLKSRTELAVHLWGEGSGLDLRTIDRLVVNIRRAIEPNPQKPTYLISVRGKGYRLEI